MSAHAELLFRLLERSRTLGFLGPAAIQEQVEHARGLVVGVGDDERVLDLGSGGGLPGLVIALDRPLETERSIATVVLLDGMSRRTAFLQEAANEINDLGGNVEVVTARAEEAGRDAALRGTFDAVLVRSFGPPAVVAECGAPFLREGGRLIVSEPPGGRPDRWPADGLRELGLRLHVVETEPVARAVMVAVAACADRYPRRVGVPARRPLFHVEHDD